MSADFFCSAIRARLNSNEGRAERKRKEMREEGIENKREERAS